VSPVTKGGAEMTTLFDSAFYRLFFGGFIIVDLSAKVERLMVMF
jgi:hypothetical protein